MKHSRKSGHMFCWALVIVLSILFLNLSHCQPQNYFKGNSMTQLPSKALPRIGRRSGIEKEMLDFAYPTTAEYFDKEKNGGETGLLTGEGEPVPFPFRGNQLSSPYALILFKRLLREGAFRQQEPTGIY